MINSINRSDYDEIILMEEINLKNAIFGNTKEPKKKYVSPVITMVEITMESDLAISSAYIYIGSEEDDLKPFISEWETQSDKKDIFF